MICVDWEILLRKNRWIIVYSTFSTTNQRLIICHILAHFQFNTCVKDFGGDPLTSSPDEFFGDLTKFLNQVAEATHQIWNEREQIERVKRQTLARSIFAKKCAKFSNATLVFFEIKENDFPFSETQRFGRPRARFRAVDLGAAKRGAVLGGVIASALQLSQSEQEDEEHFVAQETSLHDRQGPIMRQLFRSIRALYHVRCFLVRLHSRDISSYTQLALQSFPCILQ